MSPPHQWLVFSSFVAVFSCPECLHSNVIESDDFLCMSSGRYSLPESERIFFWMFYGFVFYMEIFIPPRTGVHIRHEVGIWLLLAVLALFVGNPSPLSSACVLPLPHIPAFYSGVSVSATPFLIYWSICLLLHDSPCLKWYSLIGIFPRGRRNSSLRFPLSSLPLPLFLQEYPIFGLLLLDRNFRISLSNPSNTAGVLIAIASVLCVETPREKRYLCNLESPYPQIHLLVGLHPF